MLEIPVLSPHHLQAGKQTYSNATFFSNLGSFTAVQPSLLECVLLFCFSLWFLQSKLRPTAFFQIVELQ